MVTLANSPSQGAYEVLAALRRARGYPGRHVRPLLLKLYLPLRVPLADIVTVLDAQVTAGRAHKSGNNYALTDAGALYTRQHKPRRYPIWVT